MFPLEKYGMNEEKGFFFFFFSSFFNDPVGFYFYGREQFIKIDTDCLQYC